MAALDRIAALGNRLPNPASLFIIGLGAVFIGSWIAAIYGWQEQTPQGETLRAVNLLSFNGIWWLLSSMVDNFIAFPPLGIVLVAMLGIGFAEQVGLLPLALRVCISHLPGKWLTPAVALAGILSSIMLDAGYVLLPPLAAGLYIAAGRSPLAGVAVAFAGISAGFSANLSITALDPLLTGFTVPAARLIDPSFDMAVTANWWFMMASTVLLTGLAWWVSVRIVEPYAQILPLAETADESRPCAVSAADRRALIWAVWVFVLLLAALILCAIIPGAPLQGEGKRFARWIEATVPMLLLLFLLPGIVYGVIAGTLKDDHDVMNVLSKTMERMGSYIVLAFFAAQFIEAFRYSGLGSLLAISGGHWLAGLDLSDSVLLAAFIAMSGVINMFIGSASAKYAFVAPVFVPMFMQVGIEPEFAQAAYRIGDSVTNIITPLNPYMIVVLAEFQRHLKGDSGLGTLIAMMLPYAGIFFIAWTGFLCLWAAVGLPLGPGHA
ncbi:MAG: AbgT family transporter [Candidatus Eutrophobiaceae bacterium]